MRSWANWKNMIIITEQVYETTRENISNRLITIITIIKKNILKYEKNISNINGLNLFISFSILFLTPTTISSSHKTFIILSLFIFKFIFCFYFPLIYSIWLLSFIFFLFNSALILLFRIMQFLLEIIFAFRFLFLFSRIYLINLYDIYISKKSIFYYFI